MNEYTCGLENGSHYESVVEKQCGPAEEATSKHIQHVPQTLFEDVVRGVDQ